MRYSRKKVIGGIGMDWKRVRLGLLVGLSNLFIFLGALFSQSQFTIIILFVADALFGVSRIFLEQLAAGRPRGDAAPAMLWVRLLEGLYDVVLDTRGQFSLTKRLPPLYPRNLPFVIDQWVVLWWVVPMVVLTWLGLEPVAGSFEFSATPTLCLLALKHYLIVDTWESMGIYEDAAARTIRRSRELLYTAIIACFAVWVVAGTAPTAAEVTAATMVVFIPKIPFDCREAGIGPWPLTFNPSSHTAEQPLMPPDDEPQSVFANDRRVVRDWAIHDGLSYVFAMGISFASVYGLIGLWAFGLIAAVYGGTFAVIASLVVLVPATVVVFWLGRANLTYRFHDNALVANDTFLQEPQWVVPYADIESVSVGDDALGWKILWVFNPLPFTQYPVEIERSGRENLRLRSLADLKCSHVSCGGWGKGIE